MYQNLWHTHKAIEKNLYFKRFYHFIVLYLTFPAYDLHMFLKITSILQFLDAVFFKCQEDKMNKLMFRLLIPSKLMQLLRKKHWHFQIWSQVFLFLSFILLVFASCTLKLLFDSWKLNSCAILSNYPDDCNLMFSWINFW